jgi:hypothetical protein
VRAGSPQERNLTRRAAELDQLLASTAHTEWGTLRPGRGSTGFLRPLGDDAPAPADNPDAVTTTWLVPMSMRSVDAEAGARAVRHTKPSSTLDAASAAADGTAADGSSRAFADEDAF